MKMQRGKLNLKVEDVIVLNEMSFVYLIGHNIHIAGHSRLETM
jgi:hypothetical protein